MRCLILSVGGAPSCTLSVVVGLSDSRAEDIQTFVVGDEIGGCGGVEREGERFALRRERNHLLHIVCLYDIAALVSAPCVQAAFQRRGIHAGVVRLDASAVRMQPFFLRAYGVLP